MTKKGEAWAEHLAGSPPLSLSSGSSIRASLSHILPMGQILLPDTAIFSSAMWDSLCICPTAIESGIWCVNCILPAEYKIVCAFRALVLTHRVHPGLREGRGVVLPPPHAALPALLPSTGKQKEGAEFGAKMANLEWFLAGITSVWSTSVQIKLFSNFLPSDSVRYHMAFISSVERHYNEI